MREWQLVQALRARLSVGAGQHLQYTSLGQPVSSLSATCLLCAVHSRPLCWHAPCGSASSGSWVREPPGDPRDRAAPKSA